ncbi:MAG: M43 family zinc metalloprotease [Agriterribacter sp.]
MKCFISAVLLICSATVFAQRNCGTSNYWLQELANDPLLAKRYSQVDLFTQNKLNAIKKENGNGINDEPVINIPVVIHVLYSNDAQNISDAQINSQVEVLNKDFSKLNDDIGNVPAAFAPFAADTKIHFVLAKVDPQGYATNGVIRIKTNVATWKQDDKMKYTASGGDDAWDSRYYLNIWVCNLSHTLLGYSTFPGAAVDKDGVVIRTDVFGIIGNNSSAYNKGRTTTHEIGHWFNLKHLWGDADCGDDKVDDTPQQKTYSTGCSSFPKITQGSCNANPAGDMFMNFMDFSDDACIIMFTNGQKQRMRSLFEPSGARASILESTALGKPWNFKAGSDIVAAVSIYPNPAGSDITFRNNTGTTMVAEAYQVFDAKGTIIISGYNRSTVNINRLTQGIYFIKIQYQSKQTVLSFMKQ